MKSIGQTSVFSRFELGAHVRLSQMASYFTPAERNQILAQIDQAEKNVRMFGELVQWSQTNDPNLVKFLGQDHTRFWALFESLPSLGLGVDNLEIRLSDVEGEAWYRPTGIEAANFNQWLTAVNEMKKIVDAHKAAPANVGPLAKPLPSSVTGGAPGFLSSGPTTKEILIGAGIAVGAGILIAVLT